jgi:hypothetical protein
MFAVARLVYKSQHHHLKYISYLTELLQLHVNSIGLVGQLLVELVLRRGVVAVAQGLYAIYLHLLVPQSLQLSRPVNVLHVLASVLSTCARRLVAYNY